MIYIKNHLWCDASFCIKLALGHGDSKRLFIATIFLILWVIIGESHLSDQIQDKWSDFKHIFGSRMKNKVLQTQKEVPFRNVIIYYASVAFT